MFENEKPEINYPCEWEYRIIGLSQVDVKSAVEDVMGNRKYSLIDSNRSSGGKYRSLTLTAVVLSDEDRISIFEFLKNKDAIRMVL